MNNAAPLVQPERHREQRLEIYKLVNRRQIDPCGAVALFCGDVNQACCYIKAVSPVLYLLHETQCSPFITERTTHPSAIINLCIDEEIRWSLLNVYLDLGLCNDKYCNYCTNIVLNIFFKTHLISRSAKHIMTLLTC